jgi:SAM-dependent methyltransferase
VTAWKLFEGKVAPVSTAAFHAHRDRADHLGDDHHRPRLETAAEFVIHAADIVPDRTVSDLGCGDGGLLSLLKDDLDIDAWGYDFAPANAAGWAERGVKAELLDVFGDGQDQVRFGDITVVTEVLEHVSDPFAAVRWIRANSKVLVASSPWIEDGYHHDECHAWAFDPTGYRQLLERAGWNIVKHQLVGAFQVVWAR